VCVWGGRVYLGGSADGWYLGEQVRTVDKPIDDVLAEMTE